MDFPPYSSKVFDSVREDEFHLGEGSSDWFAGDFDDHVGQMSSYPKESRESTIGSYTDNFEHKTQENLNSLKTPDKYNGLYSSHNEVCKTQKGMEFLDYKDVSNVEECGETSSNPKRTYYSGKIDASNYIMNKGIFGNDQPSIQENVDNNFKQCGVTDLQKMIKHSFPFGNPFKSDFDTFNSKKMENCGEKDSRDGETNQQVQKPKPYVCLCGKSYTNSSHLYRHQRTHVKENIERLRSEQCTVMENLRLNCFVCVCGKTCNSSSELYRHQMTHKEEIVVEGDNYTQKHCKKPKTEMLNQTFHTVENECVGKNSENDLSEDGEEGKSRLMEKSSIYQDNGDGFGRKTGMENLHEGINAYICVCGRSYSNSSNLYRHQRSHNCKAEPGNNILYQHERHSSGIHSVSGQRTHFKDHCSKMGNEGDPISVMDTVWDNADPPNSVMEKAGGSCHGYIAMMKKIGDNCNVPSSVMENIGYDCNVDTLSIEKNGGNSNGPISQMENKSLTLKSCISICGKRYCNSSYLSRNHVATTGKDEVVKLASEIEYTMKNKGLEEEFEMLDSNKDVQKLKLIEENVVEEEQLRIQDSKTEVPKKLAENIVEADETFGREGLQIDVHKEHEKPHACVCGKSYYRRSHLYRHQRINRCKTVIVTDDGPGTAISTAETQENIKNNVGASEHNFEQEEFKAPMETLSKKPHKCVCGKSYYQTSHLYRHQRMYKCVKIAKNVFGRAVPKTELQKLCKTFDPREYRKDHLCQKVPKERNTLAKEEFKIEETKQTIQKSVGDGVLAEGIKREVNKCKMETILTEHNLGVEAIRTEIQKAARGNPEEEQNLRLEALKTEIQDTIGENIDDEQDLGIEALRTEIWKTMGENIEDEQDLGIEVLRTEIRKTMGENIEATQDLGMGCLRIESQKPRGENIQVEENLGMEPLVTEIQKTKGETLEEEQTLRMKELSIEIKKEKIDDMETEHEFGTEESRTEVDKWIEGSSSVADNTLGRENLQTEKNESVEKPYPCVCGRSYYQRSNLYKHHQIHRCENLVVNTGSFMTDMHQDLKVNRKTVNFGQNHWKKGTQILSEKPYKCLCGKSYYRRSHLYRHQRMHIRKNIIVEQGLRREQSKTEVQKECRNPNTLVKTKRYIRNVHPPTHHTVTTQGSAVLRKDELQSNEKLKKHIEKANIKQEFEPKESKNDIQKYAVKEQEFEIKEIGIEVEKQISKDMVLTEKTHRKNKLRKQDHKINEKRYKCVCGKSYFRCSHLYRHQRMKKCENVETRKVDKSQAKNKNQVTENDEIVTFRINDSKPVTENITDKPYKCLCGKSYYRSSHLYRHQRMHIRKNVVVKVGYGMNPSKPEIQKISKNTSSWVYKKGYARNSNFYRPHRIHMGSVVVKQEFPVEDIKTGLEKQVMEKEEQELEVDERQRYAYAQTGISGTISEDIQRSEKKRRQKEAHAQRGDSTTILEDIQRSEKKRRQKEAHAQTGDSTTILEDIQKSEGKTGESVTIAQDPWKIKNMKKEEYKLNEKPYICVCGKSYYQTSHLYRHQRMYKCVESVVTRGRVGVGKSKTKLQRHLGGNGEIARYRLKDCKTAIEKISEKPYKCLCGKSYYRISHLYRHQRMHVKKHLKVEHGCGTDQSRTEELNLIRKLNTFIRRKNYSRNSNPYTQQSGQMRRTITEPEDEFGIDITKETMKKDIGRNITDDGFKLDETKSDKEKQFVEEHEFRTEATKTEVEKKIPETVVKDLEKETQKLNDKKFKCLCGKSYYRCSHLYRHQRMKKCINVVAKEDELETNKSEPEGHLCVGENDTQNRFGLKDWSMAMHIVSEKPYKCLCGKSYYRRSHLYRHQRMHVRRNIVGEHRFGMDQSKTALQKLRAQPFAHMYRKGYVRNSHLYRPQRTQTDNAVVKEEFGIEETKTEMEKYMVDKNKLYTKTRKEDIKHLGEDEVQHQAFTNEGIRPEVAKHMVENMVEQQKCGKDKTIKEEEDEQKNKNIIQFGIKQTENQKQIEDNYVLSEDTFRREDVKTEVVNLPRKPYICVCGRSYFQPSHLYSHQRMYKCLDLIVAEDAVGVGNVKTEFHKYIRENGEVETFSIKDWKTAMQKVYEKPYKCLCGKSYYRSSHLYRHQRMHVRDNVIVRRGYRKERSKAEVQKECKNNTHVNVDSYITNSPAYTHMCQSLHKESITVEDKYGIGESMENIENRAVEQEYETEETKLNIQKPLVENIVTQQFEIQEIETGKHTMEDIVLQNEMQETMKKQIEENKVLEEDTFKGDTFKKDEKRYKCVCGKSYYRCSHLYRHQRENKCAIDNSNTEAQKYLRGNVVLVTIGQEDWKTEVQKQSDKPYVCACGKSYYRRSHLYRHQRTHTMENKLVVKDQFGIKDSNSEGQELNDEPYRYETSFGVNSELYRQSGTLKKENIVADEVFQNEFTKSSFPNGNYYTLDSVKNGTSSSYLPMDENIQTKDGQTNCALSPERREPMKDEYISICDRSFNSSTQLYNHQKIHMKENFVIGQSFDNECGGDGEIVGDETYKCECGRSYDSISLLTTHQKTHKEQTWVIGEDNESIQDEKEEQVNGRTLYPCHDCGKLFSSQSYLTRHQRTHSGGECGESFLENSSLLVHKSIHTKEELYNCNVDLKGFAHISGLVIHQRTQGEESPPGAISVG
ncbi:uncharacterized protein LOC128667146 [Bombina bombina]|uniref:uncharacterized protein LOC128667146 n=1 Tax=Bombina bombina TaxID=8345 RepID=UPI00235AFE40|nr:uncharacterized protein LOC128667146 [Bombina bombina]